MNIWRIHLKSDAQIGIDQRKLCLEKGIVGIGWPIDYDRVPVSWEEYQEKAEKAYGDRKWKAAINAIKNRILINDLIWTRDWNGNYYLGRILSDWYYETEEEYSKADIVNVRKCEWHQIGTEESVPGKAVNSFRPSRTVQIIDDNTVKWFSQIIYNQKIGKQFYEIPNLEGKDIFSLLSYEDCEDALAIYLQVMHNYLIIPSSCKKDTMAYEFILKSRTTGEIALAQVKSGSTSLNVEDYNKTNTDIYLFVTSGHYNGTPKTNIKTIDPDIIRKFLYEHTHLLPNKMKLWIELTRK